jgi:hypothetical protein
MCLDASLLAVSWEASLGHVSDSTLTFPTTRFPAHSQQAGVQAHVRGILEWGVLWLGGEGGGKSPGCSSSSSCKDWLSAASHKFTHHHRWRHHVSRLATR